MNFCDFELTQLLLVNLSVFNTWHYETEKIYLKQSLTSSHAPIRYFPLLKWGNNSLNNKKDRSVIEMNVEEFLSLIKYGKNEDSETLKEENYFDNAKVIMMVQAKYREMLEKECDRKKEKKLIEEFEKRERIP